MSGVFLGVSGQPAPRAPLAYQGEASTLTAAAPGSGKSRCVAFPNLITHPGSIVTTDFKGELTEGTSLWRAAVLGQPVTVIDPFGVVQDRFIPGDVRGHLDPIDVIIRSRSPQTTAYGIAQGFIPPGGLKESHWAEGAQNGFVAVMKFVAFDPIIEEWATEDAASEKPVGFGRNMRTVWFILSNPKFEKAAWALMVESDDPFVSDQASAFHKASKANTEIAGIRNHIRVNLAKTLGEPAVLDALSGTNVDFSTLGKVPQSVYIVIPGDMASTLFRFMRVINSMALSEIERGGLRRFDSEQAPTVFLMDEFATLGNFPVVTEAMGRMRGFGVKFHLFVQGLSQLKDIYKDGFNTIMTNVGCLQYFGGTNDTFEAEYISSLCGTQTIVTQSPSQSGRPGDGGSESQSSTGRRIFMPDEVMRLPMPKQIIKLIGSNPVVADVIPPDLRDFPQYLRFMFCVEVGESPERAAEEACKVLPIQVQSRPALPVPKLAPKPQRGFLARIDDMLANLLGSDRT